MSRDSQRPTRAPRLGRTSSALTQTRSPRGRPARRAATRAAKIALVAVLLATLATASTWLTTPVDAQPDAASEGSEPSAAQEGSSGAPPDSSDGSAAHAAGSGRSAPAPAASSTDIAAAQEHARDAAQIAAAAVRTKSVALTPPAPDPRLESLRSGTAVQEAAEVLEMTLSDLSSREAVSARIGELRARGTGLEADVEAAREAVQVYASQVTAGLRAIRSTSFWERPSRPIELLSTLLARAARDEAADRRDELLRETRFTAAAIAYLEERADTIAQATRETEAVTEADQLRTDIARERQRLDREEEATVEVEAAAREAEERARRQREVARSELERALARQWEAIGPRLGEIAQARRVEQTRLAAVTEQQEEFAATKVDFGARIAEVEESARDGLDVRERADSLFIALRDRRRDARETAQIVRDDLRRREQAVESRQAEVEKARSELETARAESAANPADPLIAEKLELRQEQLQVATEAMRLGQMQLETDRTRWRLTEMKIHFFSRGIDRLMPHLSRQMRQDVFALTAENLAAARQNLTERIIALRIIWRERLDGLDDLTSHLGTGEGVRRLFLGIGSLFLFLFAFRRAPAFRDPVALKLLEWRRNSFTARRYPRITLKIAELIHSTMSELVAFVGIALLVQLIPSGVTELQLLGSAALWIAGYRLVIALIRDLVVPRAERPTVWVGSGEDRTRLGVDLWDLTADQARLIVRTARAILLYIVIGRIGLAAVRHLFGPGFVYHHAQTIFEWILFAIVYALCWAWRKVIVERFITGTGIEESRGAELLRKHRDRFYSVLFLAVLAIFLIARWLYRVARGAVVSTTLSRKVRNFFFRRRLERVAAEASVYDPMGETELPGAYRECFRSYPIGSGSLYVRREKEETAVMKSLEDWRATPGRGVVGLVGETGSGKSSLLTALHEQIERGDGDNDERPEGAETKPKTPLPIDDLIVEGKLTTRSEVVAWLAEGLGLDDVDSVDELVETISSLERRVVLVDQCENLFLRRVGGFEGIAAFLDIVTLTNHRLFWVLAFDRFAWFYLNRVRDRRGFFRDIVFLRPMDDSQIRTLIERRNAVAGITPNFDQLVLTDTSGDRRVFEVVKTASGYYRLLTEYARGNPRVALHYWLHSVHVDEEGEVHVTLFERPSDTPVRELEDDLLFALTAIVQHRDLSPEEVSQTINVDRGHCEVIVNFLLDSGFVEREGDGRVRLAVRYVHLVTGRLRGENYLHLDL